MAGIGFELNRLLARNTYTSTMQAYAYAGVISAGPWLLATLALGTLSLLLRPSQESSLQQLFMVSVSLIYALTLILTGPVQLVLTRYAADREFSGQKAVMFPAFAMTLAWTATGFAVLGLLLFVGAVGGPLLFRLSAALAMVMVACVWVASVFLTALKNYRGVFVSFLVGAGATVSFGWALSYPYGIGGAMIGFAAGQAVLLLVLCSSIFKELGNLEMVAPGYGHAFRKYWDLALGGLLYNLAIWVDKFMYWWVDPNSLAVSGVLHSSPVNDKVVFFAFLTIVPGLAVFLLKLETEFAARNHDFIQHILGKATRSQLQGVQDAIGEALREGLILVLKVQGLCTGVLILAAPQVLDLLQFRGVAPSTLQVALLGVFLLVVLFTLQTVLYYLDKRVEALVGAGIFTAVNALATLLCIVAGDRWFGFGFLLGVIVTVIFAANRVNYHLKQLDFHLFAAQSIYG